MFAHFENPNLRALFFKLFLAFIVQVYVLFAVVNLTAGARVQKESALDILSVVPAEARTNIDYQIKINSLKREVKGLNFGGLIVFAGLIASGILIGGSILRVYGLRNQKLQ
jgi:hypothetical protein